MAPCQSQGLLSKPEVLGSRQQQPQHRFRQILRAHPVTSTDCWKTTQDKSHRQVSPAADMATQEAFPVKHVWLYSSRSGGISAVQHVSFNIHAASVEGQIDAIRQSQQQLDQVQAQVKVCAGSSSSFVSRHGCKFVIFAATCT